MAVYSNYGVTPSGRKFHRTDGVLVQDGGHVLSGHVDKITEADGEVQVSVFAYQSIRNTMDTGSRVDPGVDVPWARHQSTKIRVQGNKKPRPLFCFADEQPDFADEAGSWPEVVEVIDVETEQLPGRTNNPPTEEFDKRDTNQDGEVSKEEKQAHKR